MPKKRATSSKSSPPVDASAAAFVPRLQAQYFEKMVPALQKELNYSSVMQVPRLQKIVINKGVGAAVADKKILESALEEISLIAGQRAVPCKAKKSISNFKLREGMPIGVRVTLRGKKMYEFLDRLTSVALPRVRDFQGISPKSFDQHGNYTLGVREQIIFPEVSIEKVSKISGMDITFATSAKAPKDGMALLKAFGLPFKQPSNIS